MMKFKRGDRVRLIEQANCIVQNRVHEDDPVPGARITISVPGHKEKWWAIVPVTMVELEQ